VLSKVKTERVSEQVINQIKKQIESKELKKGNKLPSERAMVSQAEVSRISIREALSYLSAFGIIEKKSDGHYVADDLSNVFAEPFSLVMQLEDVTFREVTKLRMVLELYTLQLAFENMDESMVQTLKDVFEKFQNSSDLDEFIRLDREFHTCITKAANSKLVLILLNSLSDSIKTFNIISRQRIFNDPSARQELFDIHARILRAFETKDLAEAEAALREHFVYVIEVYERNNES